MNSKIRRNTHVTGLLLMLISQVIWANTDIQSPIKWDSSMFSVINSENIKQALSDIPQDQKTVGKTIEGQAGVNNSLLATNLEVHAFDATPNPVRLDQVFQAKPTFFNAGGSSAINVQVDYYLSFDNFISPSDFYFGSGFVNLAPGASITQTITVNPLGAISGLFPGNYYVGVIIPSENEYWYRSGLITVQAPATADLQFINISSSPNPVNLNDNLTISSQIYNAGNIAASSVEIKYYLSDDSIITINDRYLGNDFVDVTPGNTTSESFTISPMSSINGLVPGFYYIGIIVPSENEYWYQINPINVLPASTPAEIHVSPLVLNYDNNVTNHNNDNDNTDHQLISKQQQIDNLIQKALIYGTVQVIVGFELNDDFKPEGYLSGNFEAAIQRESIVTARTDLMQKLETANTKLINSFDFIPHVVLEVNRASLEKLAQIDEVLTVQEDIAVAPFMASSNAIIGSTNAWNLGFTGSGQTVAVLDTGVDKNHPFFSTGGNKVVSEACYSSNNASASSVCPAGVTASTASGSGMPCNFTSGCTHGTHVAGTVAGNDGVGPDFGVAKDANIIAVQVFSRFNGTNDCSPNPTPCVLTFTSDQIKGLERVYALRTSYSIASVNMSLGGGQYFDVASCDAANIAIKSAIDNLRSVGIATLIASGNDGFTNSIGAPACISSAISVGATDDFDEVASFSNISSFIDLVAPGVSIRSSIPGGGLEEKNGTSMATPHVAGAWAVLKQANPNASIDTVLSALQTSATLVNDDRFGGEVNGLKRINVDIALTEFSVNQSITISNQGGIALNITSLTTNSPSPWVTWSVIAPFSIPAGGSQTVIINVDFDNAPLGLSTRRLLIQSNDTDESPYPGGVHINVNKTIPADVIFIGSFE